MTTTATGFPKDTIYSIQLTQAQFGALRRLINDHISQIHPVWIKPLTIDMVSELFDACSAVQIVESSLWCDTCKKETLRDVVHEEFDTTRREKERELFYGPCPECLRSA